MRVVEITTEVVRGVRQGTMARAGQASRLEARLRRRLRAREQVQVVRKEISIWTGAKVGVLDSLESDPRVAHREQLEVEVAVASLGVETTSAFPVNLVHVGLSGRATRGGSRAPTLGCHDRASRVRSKAARPT